jgi:hypothetical protein
MSSVLEQQLQLLEEDAANWMSKKTTVQADRKRRRLEAALEQEEKERKDRAELRERNMRALTKGQDAGESKTDRKKKQAFEAIQKKPVKPNVQEAEATLEKTSLFDFDEDDGELVEKKELEPVEMDSDLQDSDEEDSNAPVKIFRFPDTAD